MSMNYNPHNYSHFLLLQDYFPAVGKLTQMNIVHLFVQYIVFYPLYMYSAFGKYSDPMTFSSFCFMLQRYSKMDYIKTCSSSIYTQYSIMTKRKHVVGFANVLPYLHKYSDLCNETRNWAQVHPVSIDHSWDVSTTWFESTCGKFNWLDMIWKDTPVYIRSHSWQCMSEPKPSNEVKDIVCRAPRQDCVKTQIWGRVPKHLCSIEVHSGLHHSQLEEVWNHQDSS
jgi:hypothetical protein